METKKVIEQDKVFNPIEIEDLGYSLHVGQKTVGGYTETHVILKSKATEVAKAIDPRYQMMEDERDKEMIEFAWWLLSKSGQYSDDKTAHFEGRYLEQWKKIKP